MARPVLKFSGNGHAQALPAQPHRPSSAQSSHTPPTSLLTFYPAACSPPPRPHSRRRAGGQCSRTSASGFQSSAREAGDAGCCPRTYSLRHAPRHNAICTYNGLHAYRGPGREACAKWESRPTSSKRSRSGPARDRAHSSSLRADVDDQYALDNRRCAGDVLFKRGCAVQSPKDNCSPTRAQTSVLLRFHTTAWSLSVCLQI